MNPKLLSAAAAIMRYVTVTCQPEKPSGRDRGSFTIRSRRLASCTTVCCSGSEPRATSKTGEKTSSGGKASPPRCNAIKKFKLPDGSEYYGETRDGRICGQGAWRSAAGETYVGDWMHDQFHGHGRYTDADGNTVEGGFEQGVLNGVGTYHYADGRAEVGTYARGVDTGEGARSSGVFKHAPGRDLRTEASYGEGARFSVVFRLSPGGDLRTGVDTVGDLAQSAPGECTFQALCSAYLRVGPLPAINYGEKSPRFRGCVQHLQVGTYARGVDTGEGARWSTDRALAWRMRSGEVAGEISLAEAETIASSLGLPVPESIYELDQAARARLRESVASLKEDSVPDFDTYLPATSLDGKRSGALIAHSKQPLVDVAACDAIIAECEARAAKLGGWTTERHENYPTTDVPLQRLPRALAWFRKSLLPDIAFPFLARAFGFALPAEEARIAFRVIDAFVVKYDAAAGQRLLKPHRDGSVFSFNVALNDLGQYEGGGTYFQQLERAGDVNGAEEGSLRSPQGHLLAHSSALLHGGHPITSGVRYILVAFVTVEGTYSEWAYRFYEDVRDRDKSKE
ncbi:hypothetical protein CYMTET_30496 [Cymbomonas tetramitiformis]|uniref:Fe2OG dioxygenase domain-containing protein n=1 Tax=Cymbomonas tetramitiformis TaxID=36881 RepID=A0AAE0FIV7_9CHLO|nr:hypothetical protein CYMTET_30496 [Cymbomonas tetramitiformis]